MPALSNDRTDVIIVGGGIIGLACAWRAAQAGLRVMVVDDRPGGGASHVAAGMLAPVTEANAHEPDLTAMAVASARSWPSFAAELEAAAGTNVDYHDQGTILVSASPDDTAVLRELVALHQRVGLDSTWLTSRSCRAEEPMLGPRIAGGIFAADDHQVDPRRVVAALQTAAARAGATFYPGKVAGLAQTAGRVTGVRLDSGTSLAAKQVVIAAGVASAAVLNDVAGAHVPVRPVKGELLILGPQPGAETPAMTVRALVHGRPVYLVPRGDGRVVVGATQHERTDTTVTAGGIRQLLDDAVTVVPGIDELAVLETIAGARPATTDSLPLIGPAGLDGLVIAAGHHRNGVLLTPITAQAVLNLLTGASVPPEVGPADPKRFHAGAA